MYRFGNPATIDPEAKINYQKKLISFRIDYEKKEVGSKHTINHTVGAKPWEV